MDILWVILALLAAGGLGWPVTTTVLRLARSVDAQEGNAGKREESGTRDENAATAVTKDTDTSGAASNAASKNATNAAAGSAARPDHPGVLRGGLMIGILERLAVAVAILANEPVAIAYVVAIKGLGRYAELKDTPAAAERFIIGTLTSLLWACGVATLTSLYLL